MQLFNILPSNDASGTAVYSNTQDITLYFDQAYSGDKSMGLNCYTCDVTVVGMSGIAFSGFMSNGNVNLVNSHSNTGLIQWEKQSVLATKPANYVQNNFHIAHNCELTVTNPGELFSIWGTSRNYNLLVYVNLGVGNQVTVPFMYGSPVSCTIGNSVLTISDNTRNGGHVWDISLTNNTGATIKILVL